MAQMTAQIMVDGILLASRESNDFHELTAFILVNLEEHFPYAHGQIIENSTNEVLQSYRRRPIC
jgi:hypothetical protein